MIRKEEIEHAGKSYCKDCVALWFPSCAGNLKRTDILAAYRSGAEWADRTMLDKVCNWLKEHIGTYNDTIDSIHGTIKIFNKEKFIEDLRKAMEE